MSRAVVIVIFAVLGVATAKFPAFFKKCSVKDPNHQTCFLEAAQDGIAKLTRSYPEYKIPNIEPIEILELTIAPGGNGVVALEQKFKNCKLYGSSKMRFSVFEIHLPKKEFFCQGVLPDLKLNCHYEINGKVLFLPVRGDGSCTIDLLNTNISMVLPWQETKRKDNQTFVKFSIEKYSLQPEKMTLNFENLFNGDRILGENINKVLNDNWVQVWDDVQDSYEKAFRIIFVGLLNDFFSNISKEDALD